MKDITVRPLNETDLQDALKLYNYYVINTTATCQITPVDLDTIRDTIMPVTPRYKSFAILDENTLCGYALFTRFKTREAFDNTAEVTIYLKKECTGIGIGHMALELLEKEAKKAGIHVLVSLVSSENDSSIKLFEKNKYHKCAEFKDVSYKFNRYFDLICFQKII